MLADDGELGSLAEVTLSDSANSLSPTQFEFEVESPASTTLVVGRMYRFAIVALNAVGETTSNFATATISDLPAAPSAGPVMVLSDTSVDQIRVSFAAFDEADDAATGGSPIVSYHLQRTPSLGLG